LTDSLSDQAVYTFFRLGLVTGLVPKAAIFAWVDRQLLERAQLTEALIELSLAERLPYSQVAHLLNIYQEGASIDLPAKMLLALAGKLLRQDASQAIRTIQALCLLNAEYYLASELREGIKELDKCLQSHQEGKATEAALVKCLAGYLRRFARYGQQVGVILDGRVPGVRGAAANRGMDKYEPFAGGWRE
jgi:hypothetical protein